MEKKLTIENTRGLVDPCVYMLTAPNGKIYVGSTIQGFHARSTRYRNERAHCAINNALQKYSANNFTFSILESSKDWQKNKLQESEQHYLDALQPFGNRGYNVERIAGIVTNPTRRVSQFTRAGEPVVSYESLMWASDMTGADETSIGRCCKGKNPSAGGYLWLYSEEITPQEIARRVERAVSPISSNKRRVSQYTLAGVLVKEYESAKQATRETGAHASGITACCKNKKPSAGGYLWLYSKDATPQEIEQRVERDASKKKKRGVSQYTRAGVPVKEYESAKQATRETGVNKSSITACCKNKMPSAGGFLWLYSEEITPQEIARCVERAVDKKLKRPVSQYTRAGVPVKEYESARQAARETGVGATCISRCCKGKAKSAGDFTWKYTKEKPHAIESRGA